MNSRFLVLAGLALGSAAACGSGTRSEFGNDVDLAGERDSDATSIHVDDSGDGGMAKAKDAGAKDSGAKKDAGTKDSGANDGGAAGSLDAGIDGGSFGSDAALGFDAGGSDGGVGLDAGTSTSGPITGGSCLSGAQGATAIRVGFVNAGGKAQATYENNGLPDQSRWKVGVYGYTIGFTPSFVDPYLGDGGLQLDGSDFVDIELSTVGLSAIHSATLSIFGRSYNTTASGSFQWQTFDGVGSAPSGSVTNAAPYRWTSADATAEFSPGDNGVLLRIKSGPPSGALVVHKIELCIDAD